MYQIVHIFHLKIKTNNMPISVVDDSNLYNRLKHKVEEIEKKL